MTIAGELETKTINTIYLKQMRTQKGLCNIFFNTQNSTAFQRVPETSQPTKTPDVSHGLCWPRLERLRRAVWGSLRKRSPYPSEKGTVFTK